MQHAMLIPEIHEFSMLAKMRQRARSLDAFSHLYRDFPYRILSTYTFSNFSHHSASNDMRQPYEQVRKGDKLDPCLTRLNTIMPMMTISRLFLFYWLCDILQQMQSRKSGIVVSAIKSTNEIVVKLSLKTDMEKNMARIS